MLYFDKVSAFILTFDYILKVPNTKTSKMTVICELRKKREYRKNREVAHYCDLNRGIYYGVEKDPRNALPVGKMQRAESPLKLTKT